MSILSIRSMEIYLKLLDNAGRNALFHRGAPHAFAINEPIQSMPTHQRKCSTLQLLCSMFSPPFLRAQRASGSGTSSSTSWQRRVLETGWSEGGCRQVPQGDQGDHDSHSGNDFFFNRFTVGSLAWAVRSFNSKYVFTGLHDKTGYILVQRLFFFFFSILALLLAKSFSPKNMSRDLSCF